MTMTLTTHPIFRRLLTASLMTAGMLACAHAALAPEPAATAKDAFDAEPCDGPAGPKGIGGYSTCRLTVPNGDFLGALPPLGTETGKHSHPWEPAFGWWQIGERGPEHAILNHLMPWEFHGDGTPAYATGANALPGVVLDTAHASIFQWLAVKPRDGSKDMATAYLIRITYAPSLGAGSATIALKAIVADDSTELVSDIQESTSHGSPGKPSIFTAKVTVPGHTAFTQLGLAIGKGDDASPIVVQDVSVLETSYPDQDIDF
jgi:hypothetical protein